MPLTPPAPREHLHTRTVECRGFRRQDGLWDVEGRVVDTKTYGFDNPWRGRVEPGMAVHDMWIRLTLDDELEIRAVEAATEAGPYRICGDIAPASQKLVGLKVAPGFTRKTRELFGGVHGCTHLMELLGPVATTAFQTIYPARARYPRKDAGAAEKEKDAAAGRKRRSRLIDTCHALASSSEVVKRFWPEFYTGLK
ncbi:MAG: DUF2889 domain-containing protein [Rhodospirillales bacterium]